MKYLPLLIKNVWRNPLRAILTCAGVAVAIFVFTAVMSLNRGMERMLATSTGEDVLVVFDRYQGCPPMSKLPITHSDHIAEVTGVAETSATLFQLSSCSSATDIVAMHGIEPDKFRRFHDIQISEEVYRQFSSERGAAIVGEQIARRYGWQPGDAVALEALGGITFTVRGIFSAPGHNLDSVILVDLEYLQFATDQVGTVTLVHVRLDHAGQVGAVADEIDTLLASSSSPTKTTLESAFLAAAVSGMTGIIDFSRWLGYVALGMILLGVGNSLSMSIRDRTREIAILKTVGFRRPQLLGLIVAEAALASLAGGILGATAAWLAVRSSGFHLAVEGFTFVPQVTPGLLATAAGLALLIGIVAALLPSWAASRLRIVTALKEID